MPRFESDSDARRLGDALARLRRERGLSQADAGRRAGMTSQGWGLYEAGRRPGLFRPDVQRRLTMAIDATPEDLALHVDPPREGEATTTVRGVESRGRAFQPATAPASGAVLHLQLSNDALAPWAASGVVLAYEPGRWPRRGQGCVIEMVDGTLTPCLYEGADADVVVVRAGPDRAGQRLARADILALSAVTGRLET